MLNTTARSYISNMIKIYPQENCRQNEFLLNNGLSFYGHHEIESVVNNALVNFYQAHRRLPRIREDLSSYDYVFLAKFICNYPTTPNIADKLECDAFLTSDLRNKLIRPFRMIIRTAAEITRLNRLGEKKYLIKPSLGNGRITKIAGHTLPQKRKLITDAIGKNRLPYGYAWGEWIYAASENRAIIEEDITRIINSDEHQLYINNGEVKMYRLARNNNAKQISESLISYCYFDKNGNHIPGTLRGKKEHRAHFTSEYLQDMFKVAEEIAKYTMCGRVDFIPTQHGPYLNEITCFQGNARFECTSRSLEEAHLECMRFNIRVK